MILQLSWFGQEEKGKQAIIWVIADDVASIEGHDSLFERLLKGALFMETVKILPHNPVTPLAGLLKDRL